LDVKISVIVPVYNTSQYLKKCLESLLNQTLKEIEIICVDDGSTDNSIDILNEYCKKDNRIKIFTQQNKGPSAARNVGIEAAKGEYIGFIDSDDWIDVDFYEKLYNSITSTNSDIAIATILRTYEKTKKIRVKYDKEETYFKLEDKIKVCNIPKCCYVWNKLYKKELIKNIKFQEGMYYEDVLWTLPVIKKSQKLTTVPDITYYYRANKNSIVKKVQSAKKQQDSYRVKKIMINFFNENNLDLTKKQKTIVKKIKYFLNIPILKIKEYENQETYYFLGFLPIFKRVIKKPIIYNNTFIVWEPCSKSHSEVVPGYAKYLLDLGYHVSILVSPERYKEGLFSRFSEKNISYNKLTQKQIKKYFKNDDIKDVKGVLVTTAGKICDCVHYEQCYDAFNINTDKNKLFFVEHEASFAVDKNSWQESLITLRELNYKGAKSIVVNPHYFGDVKITSKNQNITNFITVGSIRPNKKNSQMIINAAFELFKKGYTNFKVTVVGKGLIKHIPNEIRKFIDIKGRLSFDKMYDEIEKADFFLMSYNENDIEHIRYNTSGTSGNFQLIYGFLKPCIITSGFAPINGLNDENSILYSGDENYSKAMERAINMSQDDYIKMQNNLKKYQEELYSKSLNNLKELINV